MFMDVIACLRFAGICLLHTGILIAYAQNRPINANADVFSTARGLNFGLSLHLHPYYAHACSEGTGESAHH